MQYRSLLEANLNDFAGQAGAERPDFDEQGFAEVSRDGKIVFHFHHQPDADTVTAFVILGVVPEENRVNLLTYALGSNLFWRRTRGATLGLDEESMTLVVQQQFALDHNHASGLPTGFDELGKVATLWQRILGEAQQRAGKDKQTAASNADNVTILSRLISPQQFA